MRIAVVGIGGVGGYFGGRLAQADPANTFLIARGATLHALRTTGLRVDSTYGDILLPHVNATDDPKSIGQVDAVLLAVKTFGIADALESIRPIVGDDTIVVPLENGIEAPDEIAAALGAKHAAGGLSGLISFIVEPGHIRHVATEPFIMLGELDNRVSDRARRLCDALVRAGIKAEIPEDIHRSMWTKFLFITPLSGIGAVTRVPVGVWRSMPEVRAMASQALREIIAIAAARGIDLGNDAEAKTMGRYDALPGDATSSLQRDIMQGKPSELDAQLGAVLRLGRSLNVATPLHEIL
ncbi:MAG: ketopantoate reductase family protein, partial [Thermoanaerobaculia bacterium]